MNRPDVTEKKAVKKIVSSTIVSMAPFSQFYSERIVYTHVDQLPIGTSNV